MLDYARSVSPVSYLGKVKAPTLLVQGQADSLFNLNEAHRHVPDAQGTGHHDEDDLAVLGPQRRLTDPAR